MKTAFFSTLLLLSAFCVLPATPAVAADLVVSADQNQADMDYARILPDNTIAVISIRDFFQFIRHDETTDVGRLLGHPAFTAGFLGTKDSVMNGVAGFLPETATNLMKRLSEKKDFSMDKFGQALGLTAKDLPRLFTGKALWACSWTPKDGAPKVDAKVDAESGDDDAQRKVKVGAKFDMGMDEHNILLVAFAGSPAEFGAVADRFRDYLAKEAPGATVVREVAGGMTLYTLEVPLDENEGKDAKKVGQAFFTLKGGTLIAAQKKEDLIETAASLDRGVAKNPLSAVPGFIAARAEMGERDAAYAFANLGAVGTRLRKPLVDMLAAQVKENPMMQAFLDPQTVVDAIALEKLDALYASVQFTDKQAQMRAGGTWKEQVGLASLFNFDRDRVALPKFVTSDYKAVSVSTMDIPRTWEATLALVKKASPQGFGMMTMMLASQPGMNKITAAGSKILDNLQPELVDLVGYANAAPKEDEMPGQVYALRVKNAAAMEEALAALRNAADEQAQVKAKQTGDDGAAAKAVPETVKEYLGVKIHKMNMPMPMTVAMGGESEGGKDMNFSYALTDGYLLMSVGKTGLMENAIANIQNPGKNLVSANSWDALGQMPGTECAISSMDLGTYLKMAINQRLARPQIAGAPEFDMKPEEREELLKARKACGDLHWNFVGKSYYTPSGFFMRRALVPQTPGK